MTEKLITPEPTLVARAKGFDREVVTQFYNLLEEITENNPIVPKSIYNIDETGVRQPRTFLSQSGKKHGNNMEQ